MSVFLCMKYELYFKGSNWFLDNCTTPNNIQGQCVRLNLCKPLRELARETPLSALTRDFLRKSQCNIFENYPWVCCESEKTSISTRKSKSPTRKSLLVVDDPTQLLNPKVCGTVAHNLEDRIFGGTETSIGEFPW